MESWAFNSRSTFLKRWLQRELSKDHRITARRVARGQKLPTLGSLRHSDARIWAISMVKNEADIVEAFVEHVFAQGIDRLLIADNGSTDGTFEILEQMAQDLPISLGRDTEFGYFQAHKMSRLAAIARKAGALWIVPMDADEFWFAEEGTVAEFLRSCPAQQVAAKLHNVFPTPGNSRLTGIVGQVRIDRQHGPHGKVAARSALGLWIGMGNHQIERPGAVVTGLHLLHVPWRSEQQFRRKVEQGAAALAVTNLSEELGTHWRLQAALGEDAISARWISLLQGVGHEEMDWAPSSDTRVVEARDWGSWGEVQAALN